MIKESIQQFRAQRAQKSRLSAGQSKAKTKARIGLAMRDAEKTTRDIRSAERNTKEAAEGNAYDPASKIEGWYQELQSIREERGYAADMERSTTGAMDMNPLANTRPEARYETEFRGEVELPEEIKENQEFTGAVQALAEKYNIDPNEVYAVIQGESAFNPSAQNASGATGLFQFMPTTAEELGTSTEAIRGMSAVEQVELYDKYLDRWNYSGENRLGIMQAAPAYADRSAEEVIYAEGTAAWDQNPGWRELGDGPITVRSINNYYAKKAG